VNLENNKQKQKCFDYQRVLIHKELRKRFLELILGCDFSVLVYSF